MPVGRLLDQSEAAPEIISLIKRNNCGRSLNIYCFAWHIYVGNCTFDQ